MEEPGDRDMQTQNPSSSCPSDHDHDHDHHDHLQSPTISTHADPQNTIHNNLKTTKLERFKETILRLANNGDDHHFVLSPSQLELLHQRLSHPLPFLDKTPTHPTYFAMITKAIEDLDKEGTVASGESISEYVKKNFDGLPWAHERILSHHLSKLCESGELVFVRRKFYSLPDKVKACELEEEKSPKRKLRKRKREGLSEEENVGGEDVLDYHDEVGFGEEDSQSGKSSVKRRRRRSLIVDDEEEDDGDGILTRRVVTGEANVISGREIVPVIEGGNELSEQGGRVDVESNKLEQVHAGKVDEDNDLVDNPDKDCPTNPDSCEGKIEDHLAIEAELETNPLQINDDNANLMLVVVDNVKEQVMEGNHQDDSNADLLLAPVVVDPLASAPNVKSVTSKDTVKPIMTERQLESCASKMMIVPYKELSVDNVILLSQRLNPLIVCGLPVSKPETPKRKPKTPSPRKRSRAPKQKTKSSPEGQLQASSALPSGVILQLSDSSKHKKPETKVSL